MPTFEELYQTGARLYQERDYAGAELAFRELLSLLPTSQAKDYGRAAYSLGLALEQRQRYDEAKEALRLAIKVDPALTLAQKRLQLLDEVSVVPETITPSTPGGIIGRVSHVDVGSEPDPWFGQQRNTFLRFRLSLLAGAAPGVPTAPTIELRGQRIEGSVKPGDVVEVPAPWRPGQHPRHVLNHTTGDIVRSSSGSRPLMWAILVFFLILIIAFMAFVFYNLFAADGPPGPPGR
jgi:hypothetical protein